MAGCPPLFAFEGRNSRSWIEYFIALSHALASLRKPVSRSSIAIGFDMILRSKGGSRIDLLASYSPSFLKGGQCESDEDALPKKLN